MPCEEARLLIDAHIDGEIDADGLLRLDAHRSACPDCRASAEALRLQDADLLRAMQPRRDAAAALAERVLTELQFLSRAAGSPSRTNGNPTAPFAEPLIARRPSPDAHRLPPVIHRPYWFSIALATVAGFLLAVILYPMWKTADGPITAPQSPPVLLRKAPAIAQLVTSTGPLQVRADESGAWSAIPPVPAFQCAPGTAVRTGKDARCELRTSDGCVVRLNGDTEVKLLSGRMIELSRGEMWCRAPQNASLDVVSPASDTGGSPATPRNSRGKSLDWTMSCPSQSAAVTVVGHDGGVNVVSADGEVDVRTATGRHRLRPGETATIAGGRLLQKKRQADGILRSAWIHPILMRKGHADAELAARVDALLARIGHSKVSLLYEREIRSLGEYCVLPLLRYVQSSLSQQDRGRRSTAMRIIADVAPTWAIRDLIDLLADKDEQVRQLAAAALARLTGLTHGRRPEQWRGSPQECSKALKRWRDWWRTNSGRFPRPPVPRTFKANVSYRYVTAARC